VTPPHVVFDAICSLAAEEGLRVTGSELVGLIPKEAMLLAGRHYLKKQGACEGVPEKDIIRTAIQSLGLSDISEFVPEKKIIEYLIETPQGALKDMTLSNFCDELSRSSPAPGGGSVAALCGALSASLSSMVANLTFSKKGYENLADKMNLLAIDAQKLKDVFISFIDRDTAVFNNVMSAMKMSKKTDKEKKARNEALQEALKKAAEVPLEVLAGTVDALHLARTAIEGNKNSLSDAGVAVATALAAAKSAFYNVMINLEGIEDENIKTALSEKAYGLMKEAGTLAGELENKIDGMLNIKMPV